MSARIFVREAAALLGLFATLYLWSVLVLALNA